MREEADSPDSDDSFGFVKRKSNFMEIGNGAKCKKPFTSDGECEKDMSRTTLATVAHSHYGGPEPPSLLMGLSDTAANLMLSTSDEEEEEDEGKPGRNLPDTSTKEATLALNTASQLPQRRAQSANSSRRRTKPLSSQCHSGASTPMVNSFSEKATLNAKEPNQGETEDYSMRTAFHVSPNAQHDTCLEDTQTMQLESQGVMNEQKALISSSPKMEGPDGQSRNNRILNEDGRLLRKRIIHLEGVVENLKHQVVGNEELHKSVQTSQKEEHESAMAHLKELHQEEIESLRLQLNGASLLKGLAEKIEASANSVELLKAEVTEAHNSNELARSAQLDARERLISDLEGSARKTQEIARGETEHLQGVLGSVNSIVQVLHDLNSENRNRFHHELTCLEGLREYLLPEVTGLRKELEEEHACLAERRIALEEDGRSRIADFSSREQRCQEQSAQLKREQAAFLDQQISARASAEEITRLHCEDKERLSEAYSKLQRESSCFEDRVKEARNELRDAEHARAEIKHARQSIEADRTNLSDLANKVLEASEQVSSRIREADRKLAASESIKAEALAHETMVQAEENACKAQQVYRQNKMDHISISKALVDAQHERGEAHRLRVELQERKQKLLEGPHSSVVQSGQKLPVNGVGSISSQFFSPVNQQLQSQLLVAQNQPPPFIPSRHDVELNLNMLCHSLDESTKYLSTEEVFVNAYTVEDPIIGITD